MLKRGDAPYVSGRPKGPWFKWKRDPLTVDAVLMYAQRGHGKRSSFYSDFTFGTWRPVEGEEGPMRELVPVGKAYFGFTDQELAQLDKWCAPTRSTRFGPVRAVEPGLVLEIAFDSVHRSPRHKSGVAMRFPRVHRIRWGQAGRRGRPPGDPGGVDPWSSVRGSHDHSFLLLSIRDLHGRRASQLERLCRKGARLPAGES